MAVSDQPHSHCKLKFAVPCRRRGKQNQKHYTVYLAAVSPEAREKFTPQLNEEHSAYKWFSLAVRVSTPPCSVCCLVLRLCSLYSNSSYLSTSLPARAPFEHATENHDCTPTPHVAILHVALCSPPLQEAFNMEDLHPVVKRVFKKGAQHRSAIRAVAAP